MLKFCAMLGLVLATLSGNVLATADCDTDCGAHCKPQLVPAICENTCRAEQQAACKAERDALKKEVEKLRELCKTKK